MARDRCERYQPCSGELAADAGDPELKDVAAMVLPVLSHPDRWRTADPWGNRPLALM